MTTLLLYIGMLGLAIAVILVFFLGFIKIQLI